MSGALNAATPPRSAVDPQALGPNTMGRHLRVVASGSSTEVSTLLPRTAAQPPWWIWEVLNEAIDRDEGGIILSRVFVRLAQIVEELSPSTPRPYVGIGDDGTVGLEWDLPSFHIEIQFGNDEEDDVGLIELSGQIIFEEPLARATPPLLRAFQLAVRPRTDEPNG